MCLTIRIINYLVASLVVPSFASSSNAQTDFPRDNCESCVVLDGETLHIKSEMSEHDHTRSRERRYVLYPPMSIVQFTFLYAMPMELMPKRMVIIVLGGQIGFDLPSNLTQLTVQSIARHGADIDQPSMFRAAQLIMDQQGLPGRSCMLLAVCQLAETPLDREAGLLEDIIHLVLTPSEGSHIDDWDVQDEKQAFLEAEAIGKQGLIDCRTVYPECNVSLLDAFSKIVLS